jgi:CubicO group peptidase (beta-lactamase class C family)
VKNKLITVLITFSSFWSPVSVLAQDSILVHLDAYMKAVQKLGFNGNVLVAKKGRIIYQQAFGYRNLDTKEPLDNNSVFTVASVSKQFTAAAILLLKEQHKLELTDSLRQYFPELPYHDVTIKEMLTHTSGLPDYFLFMGKYWDHNQIAHNGDVIRLLAEKKPPAFFKPGSRFRYSNTAYVVLASIVEKVSGQSFNDFVADRIFKPLHMKQSRVYTTLNNHIEKILDYAEGFTFSDSVKRYVPADSVKAFQLVDYLAGTSGDKSIATTTGDLLKWDIALKHSQLLEKADLDNMMTPRVLIDTTLKIYYGYGVELGKTAFGNYVSHEGIWPGYRTIMTRYKEADLTVEVLSNNESNAIGTSIALTNILFNKEVILPYKHIEIKLAPDNFNAYLGSYLTPGPMQLITRDGRLYRHKDGTTDIELKPESETKFFYADSSDRQIEFKVDNGGHVLKVYLIANGIRSELTKTIDTNQNRENIK